MHLPVQDIIKGMAAYPPTVMQKHAKYRACWFLTTASKMIQPIALIMNTIATKTPRRRIRSETDVSSIMTTNATASSMPEPKSIIKADLAKVMTYMVGL
jgi:hypothetical protein